MSVTEIHDKRPHRELGARIKKARAGKGISQERLAPLVGVTRRHLIRIENGEHCPSDELLERIAEATGQPLDFFRAERHNGGAAAA